VTPSAGPVAGGTKVKLTGARFGAATRVLFGGQPGSNLHVLSATALTVVAPARDPGTVDVRVVSPYGRSPVVAADRYAYVAPPTVTNVSPSGGPASGGTVVTIDGTNLGLASAVWFGGTPATDVTVNSSTRLTVTAPAHATGSVDVTVRTPGGTSATGPADTYTYQ
jgi:hypothetical protein